MVQILNVLALVGAASALAIVPRATPDATTIQNDLYKLDNDTITLNKTITAWDGTLKNFGTITDAATVVDNDIKQGTYDAGNATTNATDAQAASIINYINTVLEPNTNSTLKNLISRKAQIASAGAQSLTKSRLNTLKTDGDNFAAALLKKTPPARVASGQAALNKIDADFQTAINAFT